MADTRSNACMTEAQSNACIRMQQNLETCLIQIFKELELHPNNNTGYKELLKKTATLLNVNNIKMADNLSG